MKNIVALYSQLEKLQDVAQDLSCDGIIMYGDYSELNEKVILMSDLINAQRLLLPLPLQEFHHPPNRYVLVHENPMGETDFTIFYYIKERPLRHQFAYQINIERRIKEKDVLFYIDDHVRRFKKFVNAELKEKFPDYYERYKLIDTKIKQ